MKINKTYIIFCVAAIALFFVGRFTSRPVVIDNKHTIDSLTISARTSQNRALMAEARAHKAFQKGLESQKAKVIVRTIYRNQVVINHALPPTKKDSVIKEMFRVDYSDSSKFTKPVANGILDLNTDNKALRAEAKLDSVSLSAKDEGIQELGQVINSLTDEGGAKDGLITVARNETKAAKKEVRKQKRLKWAAIITTFIFVTLAISKS